MSLEEIKRRISALEGETRLSETCCLVLFPDGSEQEITLAEWLDHAAEWKIVRITQGREISLLLCSLLSMESEGSDDPVRIRAANNIRRMIMSAGGIR